MSIDEISLSSIQIVPDNQIIDASGVGVDICVDTDISITGHKNEYAIVGDAFFATVSAGETPPWMVDLIDDIINNIYECI